MTSSFSAASDLVRTFVAVEVPEGIKERIAEIVDPLRREYRVRWTRPEGWHITLKFLGERTAEEVQRIIDKAGDVASRLSPFDAALGGWGSFPSAARPRVLWLGATTGAEALTGAAAELDAALGEAGFPRDDKRFHPHLTIARVDAPRAGTDALKQLQASPLASEPFLVDRITVFRSILDRAGARYHPLAVAKLGGGPHERDLA